MTRTRLVRTAVLTFVLFLTAALGFEAAAQFELPKRLPRIPVGKIPGLDKIPGMDKLLGKETPITTSLPDILSEVPFLDSFNPVMPMSAGHAARTSDAQFRLSPGAWTYEAQSYCLKAGTYAPGRGSGYAYAPLKGPKANIVRSILRRSIEHPEVRQQDVQVLLWAIIARAKLSEMPRNYQLTAAKLLTPKELFELNGGALGILPDSVRAKLVADLPPALKTIIEAENRLRQLMSQVNASFDEIERVAVLVGNPPPTPGDRNDLPYKRWSYHPDGYFIRFAPSGYSHTQVDIFVPKPYTIVRDRHDRIILISDQDGRRIDMFYEPNRSKGNAAVEAHKFARVRFVDESLTRPLDIVTEWKKTGWTLVGVPDSKSNTVSGETADMANISARLSNARRRKDEIEKLLADLPKVRGSKRGQKTSSQALLRDLVDLASLFDALSPLVEKSKTNPRAAAKLQQVQEAWQDVLHRGVSEQPEQRASLGYEGPGTSGSRGGDGSVDVDPAGNVGQPGETGRQRIGQSGRCAKECGCDRKEFCDSVKAAIEAMAEERGNARSTAASRAQAAMPHLKELAKGLCDNPGAKSQVDQMIQELGKIGSGSRLQDNLAVVRVEMMLEDMQKQVCGGPPPPKPCPGNSKEKTPDDEQAAKQVEDALQKAYDDALEELHKFDEGIPEYIQKGQAAYDEALGKWKKIEKMLGLWKKINATKCLPPNLIPLMKQVLENQRRGEQNQGDCNLLCDVTAKWFGDLMDFMGSPEGEYERQMFMTCGAWCQ
jgi:hypothetical protein